MSALRRGLLVASALASGTLGMAGASQAGPDHLDVVFIFNYSARDGGWNETFDNARMALDESFGDKVSTSIKEQVVEGPQALRVIESAIQEGADVVVSNSFGYGEPMIEAARKHPEVFFITSQWENPGDLDNFVGYDNAPEDGAYIGGIAAGHIVEPGAEIGWVDAFPIPYDLRTINGFALGLAKSNPTATVNVIFTNDWADVNKQSQAARSLIDSGVKLMSSSLTSAVIGEVAERAGVPYVAPALDGSKYAPQATVTTFQYTWAPAFAAILQSIFDDEFDTAFVYSGMADGAVSMAPWGPPYEALTDDEKAEVDAEIQRLKDGGAVFVGPLTDKAGNEVLKAGDTLSVDALRSLNFVLPNVEGVGL